MLSIGGESSWTTFYMLTWKTNVSLHVFIDCSFHPVFTDLEHIHPFTSDTVIMMPVTLQGLLWKQSQWLQWHIMIIYCAFTTTLCFSLSFLGIQQADQAEMKLMASTPHRSHVFKVANFNAIKNVQKELITQVCAGVDNQLSSIVSGEEGKMW